MYSSPPPPLFLLLGACLYAYPNLAKVLGVAYVAIVLVRYLRD